MKTISESELNQTLFLCIDNFRIDEQTDECLFLLLRYLVVYAGTKPIPTAKSVLFMTCRWTNSTDGCLQNSSTNFS